MSRAEQRNQKIAQRYSIRSLIEPYRYTIQHAAGANQVKNQGGIFLTPYPPGSMGMLAKESYKSFSKPVETEDQMENDYSYASSSPAPGPPSGAEKKAWAGVL